MVLETVKATYDPDTRSMYVTLAYRSIVIDKTVTSMDTEIHYDIGSKGEIVGIEVILS